jgi:hypothetical protein
MVARPPPITDSPLFWLLLFGSVGLVMLAAVEPKFVKRQERIERMQQSRQLDRRSDMPAAARGTSPTPSETPAWQPSRRATLRPLAVFLAAMLVAAMGVMHLRRRQAFAAFRNASSVGEEGKER